MKDLKKYQSDSSVYLRQTLGICGMLLPILDFFFATVFGTLLHGQPIIYTSSISATHYANSYLLFEGLVFGVGLFLICYRGYDIKDWWLSTIAGIGAIMLTLFPCNIADGQVRNFLMLPNHITNIFHGIGAGTFFLTLAYIIIFQFTKSSKPKDQWSAAKKKRNMLYRIFGIMMLVSLGLGFGLDPFIKFSHCIFIGEAFALEFFGLAWLLKGNTFLKDEK